MTTLECHSVKLVGFWNAWTRYPHVEVSGADIPQPLAGSAQPRHCHLRNTPPPLFRAPEEDNQHTKQQKRAIN